MYHHGAGQTCTFVCLLHATSSFLFFWGDGVLFFCNALLAGCVYVCVERGFLLTLNIAHEHHALGFSNVTIIPALAPH